MVVKILLETLVLGDSMKVGGGGYWYGSEGDVLVSLCTCLHICVLQSCDVMATASVNRPGSAQSTEKSQLTLKGNES